MEPARALAGQVDCELVTFGPRPATWRSDAGLRIRVLRPVTRLHGHPAQPVAPLLPAALTRAQVVHAHHFRSVPTRMSAVTARVLGVGTAVTNHGLLGRTWGGLVHWLFDASSTRRFIPVPGANREGVLFVGRLTSHKGIDRLIRALPAGAALRIAGSSGHDPRPPERDYPALLRRLAHGQDVTFLGPVPGPDLPGL